MPTTFRLGDAWLNEYFPNRRLVKVFIQPNVSYGSLGKSVMPTTFRLGDTWLHENQLNHHKWEVFGLNLCNQGMNFSSPDKYLIVYPTAPKWVPKRSPFFSRSPLSPFQTEERAKSQSSHYLLNVDHLNTCDDKTSFNESHASLSVKLSFVLKYSNTCMCFLLCISRN